MDAFQSLLFSYLRHLEGPCLLVADENFLDTPFSHLAPSVQLISNRFDIAQQVSSTGRTCIFNDFDFSVFNKNTFQTVFYRVSKEKPISHHIINQSLHMLEDGGQLILAGEKNDGLKTYVKKAGYYFSNKPTIEKQGPYYFAKIKKTAHSKINSADRTLTLKDNYERLIKLPEQKNTADNIGLYSKPGLFGWKKVDRGSALLAQCLPAFFDSLSHPPKTLLDLGCGYGYLSVMAARCCQQCDIPTQLFATDNCAAALIASQKNFDEFSIQGEVIADDCANGIQQLFDVVLCNPPFHQGFKTDSRLTEKFIRSAAKHLKADGKALFVINQFVPLEKFSRPFFNKTETLLEQEGFRVLAFTK